jgi:iron complex outermembrane receptor protein
MNGTISNAYLRRAIHAICFGGASTLLTALPALSRAAPTDAAPTTGSTAAGDSAAAQGPATSQGTGASDTELSEIVVTSYRASLQENLDIKRNSDGIVDAISAEDIGKFPDANLATAMERIPGVTVSRQAVSLTGTGGTSSGGGSTQITVRGLGPQFNETLFDGREVPTAIGNTTRGFDFGSVGSDFVGQVDVLKTPDASLSSGAIGATVNIKYPKPFDHPGLLIAGSLSGDDSTGENKIKPNGGLLFSDTFADDRLGILVDGAYAESQVRGNHVNIQGWEGGNPGLTPPGGLAPCQLAGAAPCAYPPGSPPTGVAPVASATPSIKDWFVQDYGIYQEHTDDKRIGGRIALQAKPIDGLELTFDDNYSQEKLVQNQYGFSAWFNNGALTDVTQAPDGTVTSFLQPGTPTDFQAQINQSVIQTNTAGLNVKWDATAHTSYMFDAYTAVAKLNPGGQASLDSDIGYGNGPNATSLGIVVPGGHNLPYPVGYGPGGDAANFINPAYIGSHVVVESYNQNKDSINQFKLEGNWHDDALKFKYGVQYTHDADELRNFTDLPYTWQMYAGYGPKPIGSGGVAPIPANLISSFFTTGSNFINGWGNGGKLPPGIIAANGYSILNYLQGLNGAGQNVTACSSPTNPHLPCNGRYIMYPNSGLTQDVTENTVSPYLNMSTTVTVENMPLNINIGARLEDTHVTSAGISSLPTGQLYILTTDHTAYGFSSTPPVPISTKSDYRYLLPNIDLSLGVTDTVKVRVDLSRTLTRAPLSDLTPDLNVPAGQRVGALNGTGGNPTLLPYLSDNLDFGAEWYYAQNSYVSADAFVKEVSNFVVGGTVSQPINGVTLPGGSQAIFSVTSQVNGPSAEIRGIELAWQYTIGDSGFGFQSNATFVSTNKPYNPNDLTVSNFAVPGLANSFNFIPFFDKYGFQARVAINHQDSYLQNYGQTQNNSQFGIEPTFVNAATYVDFSTSYNVTRHFSVYFEALNLTDQAYSTHGRFTEQVLDVVDTGRLFTLGAHVKF